MKFFDNPIQSTYLVHLDVIAAAVGLRFTGPAGARGRIQSFKSVVTEALGTGDALVRVGTAADPDAYASMTVPVAGSAIDDIVSADPFALYITPDSTIQIDTDGGATTTGEVDVEVNVAWERNGPV